MTDTEKSIDDFFKMYFKKEYKYIANSEDIKSKYETIAYPDMDFIFLFKFVRIEIDHLQSVHPMVVNDVLRQVFKYSSLTVKTLVHFTKNRLSSHVIYKNSFSLFNEEIKNINEKLKHAIAQKDMSTAKAAKIKDELDSIKKDGPDYKVLNNKLADSVQDISLNREIIAKALEEQKKFENKVFNLFLNKYKVHMEYIHKTLIKQLGFFTFLSNKTLWENTFNDTTIMKFFQRIDLKNANIITYMQHHLKSQTSDKSKGKDQIVFREKLKNAITILDTFYKKQSLKNL